MSSNKPPDDFTVFISYAHEDNESPDRSKRWLDRLLQHLQPLVYQKKVRPWSDTAIESGERWHESIQTQLRNARAAVLLVSPAFLASEYIRNSELPVLLMNARDKGVTILPIILRRCLFTSTTFKYPDSQNGPEQLPLSTFQSENSPDKPLNAMQEHEQDELLVSAAERILRIVGQSSPRSPTSGAATASGGETPKVATPIWHVPHPRNLFFTGRAQTLDRLHRALIATGKAALSGMGGVGKTQTAVEYAYRHRGEYRAVLWVKADTEDSLKADFAALAATLNLPESGETDRDLMVAAVKRWLEAQPGWLLILDNADEFGHVADVLRHEWGGHIIVTTRAHATGAVSKVEITEMPTEEGTLFLLRRAKLIAIDDPLGAATEADQELAAEITHEVDGLPLALDQAGAFIEEMSSSLGEYLNLYRKEGTHLRAARGGTATDHDPVSITFSLAFRQVEAASAAATDMLRVCTFLAPDAIPEEIFSTGAAELGENLASVAGGGINLVKTIGEAGRFSLIRRNAKRGTIEIHRLVQQVLRDEMDTYTSRLWAERAVRALNASFPEVEHKNWLLCERLLPHVQEAARLIDEYGFNFNEAARLLNLAGWYCSERAQYAEAGPLLLRALEIREKVLGPEQPDVAQSLNSLASLYSAQGRYAEAEPLFSRALDIREKSLGPDHPEVATSLNDLALLYKYQGKYTHVEPLYVRSLSIRDKVFGPDHPSMAVGLNNLASLYETQGRYAEAEPLFLRALAIREKSLGPDHPDVAWSLNHLAVIYEVQGRYAEAEPLFLRALDIREKALGPDHPYVAPTLSNLANLYISQGRYAEAEPLFSRALDIREKSLGPEHPEVATSLNNLANLYRLQGRYAEAEPLYVRALAINEKVFGPEHPYVAWCLNNLGVHYELRGRYAEAESLYVRALAIREKVFDPKHPYVAWSLANLANLYRLQGRYAEAGPPNVRALDIREKSLGPEHPEVAWSLNNLANLYRVEGRYAEAEPLFLRALAIREKALGPDHPYVAPTLNNLAHLHISEGRYAEAEPLFLRALDIRETSLGPEHPEVALILNGLALLYVKQGRYSEAELLFLRALGISEKTLGPEHPYVATSLNGLALLYDMQGRYTQAESLYARALKVYEKTVGPDHPDSLLVRKNHTALREKM